MAEKNSLEMREERGATILTAERIAKKAEEEKRSLTVEEAEETAKLLADAEEMDKVIERLETSEKLCTAVAERAAEMRQPQPRVTTPNAMGTDGAALAEPKIPAQYRKYAPLTMFKGPNADERAFQVGMWARARFFGDSYADKWCMANGVYHQLAQSEGTATAGGDLVPAPLANAIIENRDKFGVIRGEVDVVPMSRDTMTIPRVTSDTTATFADENTAITEGDAAFDQVNLTARKMGRIIRYSKELAADAVINLADWLARDIARSFSSKEDEIGFVGDGTAADGSVLGVAFQFTNDNSLAGAVEALTGDEEFEDLTLPDLHKLMATLPEYATAGAKFYCSNYAFQAFFMRLAAAGGGNAISDFNDDLGMRFLGVPIVRSSKLAGSGTHDNETMILYGDLRMACVLGERSGFELSFSDQRYWVEDQHALKATQRIDFNAHGIGDGSTAGAVVALVGST